MEFPKICADLGCLEFVKWVRILAMDDLDDHQTDIWGFMMASSKTRPAGVPEENVYEKMHWMVILTYAAAIAAVALLMHGAG